VQKLGKMNPHDHQTNNQRQPGDTKNCRCEKDCNHHDVIFGLEGIQTMRENGMNSTTRKGGVLVREKSTQSAFLGRL